MAKKQTKNEPKSIRDGFGEGLVELGKNNPDVVALSADLAESVRMQHFAEMFPDRFVQVGIAEQNMATIAAGLALSGKVPYIGSFACFQPMRNLDQIRTSICIMEAPVKIVSSHAGFSFPGDGVQIQALEDIAIMRTLPNMEVYVPADAEQTAQIAKLIANTGKPAYLRLGRAKTDVLAASELVDKEIMSELELGKAQTLLTGSDGTIIATGYMVMQALLAAHELRKRGVYVGVMNIHTIKPLDREAIARAAQETGRIVTVEEHQVAGGLGSAVAETLMQWGVPVNMKIIGVDDQFGITAETVDQLWSEKGLTVENIVDNMMMLLK